MDRAQLQQLVIEEARRQGVDPREIMPLVNTESRWNPGAVSPKGAAGLMQIMPATGADLGVSNAFDLLDPKTNVAAGVRYYKQQRDKFGSPELAYAAYNAGPGAVQKAGGVPNYPETQNYVRKNMAGQKQSNPFDAFDNAPQQPEKNPFDAFDAQPAKAQPKQDAKPQERTFMGDLGRQVGLSLRAPVQAGAELLGMLGDPLNATANLFGANLPPLSQTLTRGIDAAFPTPETDREKFVNKVAAGGYSAALPIGAASAAKPASELGRRVTAEMVRGPTSQILGGSAAAGASELAAQDGSGLPGQIAAGVIGGMVGGKAGNVASRVGNAAGQAAGRVAGSLPGAKAAASAQTDGQIAAALQQQGITFSELDSNVKSALRNATAGAAKAGQTADPAALARLARFQSLGIEPTAAMVTRDPYAWANEKRLSKLDEIGRPLVDRYRAIDQTLGNEIAGLSGRAPEALPAADAAGDAVGAAVRNAWKSSGEGVDKMYDAYRAANPYANVPGQQVADAYGNIAREYGKSQIPSDVMERLNAFGFTNPDRAARTAFTVQEADTLKRLIGNNLNPANRTQAKALGILGNSIDDAMRSGADSASTGALLTEARAAAKQRFDAFKPRPLDALVNGNVGPERWLDTHVLSKSTSAADMARTMKQLDSLGDGVSDQVRGAAAKWLMDKAYSNDPSRKAISGVALDTAIKQVGERKLAAIFGQEGLTRLRDIAAAAKDARFDVVDSAVNRSNTGSDIANMMLKVTRIPGFSTLNTGSLGLAGGLLNMGAKSLNDSANAKAVAQAMRGGIAATPQMQAALGLRPQAPNSLLRPLLPTSLALPGSLDSRERNQR